MSAQILAHPTLGAFPSEVEAFEAATGLRLFPTASGYNVQALPAIGNQPVTTQSRYGGNMLAQLQKRMHANQDEYPAHQDQPTYPGGSAA